MEERAGDLLSNNPRRAHRTRWDQGVVEQVKRLGACIDAAGEERAGKARES